MKETVKPPSQQTARRNAGWCFYSFDFKRMGSPCALHFYSRSKSNATEAAQAAIESIARLEKKYSRYQAHTLTSQINQNAGTGQLTPLDAETQQLIALASQAYEFSDGLFDLTCGVLRNVWDFKSNKPPAPEAVENLLPLIGWDKVYRGESCIHLSQVGMEIDFGGLVKEYAADTAASTLEQHQIQFGLVDLGGDLRVLGPHPSGKPWIVGIRNPWSPLKAIHRLSIKYGAVATSGQYERFFDYQGKRYCHILNPRTGWPTQGLASVTSLSNICTTAGIISTLAMLKSDPIDWLRSLGLPFIGVDQQGQVMSA